MHKTGPVGIVPTGPFQSRSLRHLIGESWLPLVVLDPLVLLNSLVLPDPLMLLDSLVLLDSHVGYKSCRAPVTRHFIAMDLMGYRAIELARPRLQYFRGPRHAISCCQGYTKRARMCGLIKNHQSLGQQQATNGTVPLYS